jgi:hypothetical protein
LFFFQGTLGSIVLSHLKWEMLLVFFQAFFCFVNVPNKFSFRKGTVLFVSRSHSVFLAKTDPEQWKEVGGKKKKVKLC